MLESKPLELLVGRTYTRAQLREGRGGQRQSGIVTPAKVPEILVFSDAAAGAAPGYNWDGWPDATEQVFYYTGEGQTGDQEFSGGNLALRDAQLNGKAVHLFTDHGRQAGSQTVVHRYEGEFTVDPVHGWRREDGPDKKQEMRSAIVFELHRADGNKVAAAEGKEAQAQPPSAVTTVRVTDAEGHYVDEFTSAGTGPTAAVRRERQLENKLKEHLARQGISAQRLEIRVAGQGRPLLTDTWDATHWELYEAKGTATRVKIREAIGQLMDYRRHITPPPTRCTILVPSDPGADLRSLIHSCGFDLMYQEAGQLHRKSPGVN
ncbi:hypothetical protein IEE92_13465 [Kocuria sp. cx-116]|uniref:hypothetical protein n=1 Tax=Kocuria sp. cx-116 TaxID=2771378 RepID=UPI001685D6F5|nr:hypothetical protein [Kocuria sp. cx-116]MBD2763537.1 hypothetical protein [Kocuria sp. cx-116]